MPITIAEQFHFHRWQQGANETTYSRVHGKIDMPH